MLTAVWSSAGGAATAGAAEHASAPAMASAEMVVDTRMMSSWGERGVSHEIGRPS
jgi:hypothetical protein